MSNTDLTKPPPNDEDRRHRRSQRSRAHEVTTHPVSERQYSATEVARIAGVSYRQVDTWIRGRHLAASVAPAGGSGNPRVFGFSDVARAVALAYLSRDMGVVLSVADRVLVDCHRKARCTADFGAVRLTVDMTAVRKKVAAS